MKSNFNGNTLAGNAIDRLVEKEWLWKCVLSHISWFADSYHFAHLLAALKLALSPYRFTCYAICDGIEEVKNKTNWHKTNSRPANAGCAISLCNRYWTANICWFKLHTLSHNGCVFTQKLFYLPFNTRTFHFASTVANAMQFKTWIPCEKMISHWIATERCKFFLITIDTGANQFSAQHFDRTWTFD